MIFLKEKLFCIPGVLAMLLFLLPSFAVQSGRPRPTTIIVEKVDGRVSYKVDSRHVDDLLQTLNQVADRSGPNQSVNVIIDSRLPSSEIWNVDGVAGKVQLTNLRFFVFFHDTKMMSEIKRLPAVPFSAAPN